MLLKSVSFQGSGIRNLCFFLEKTETIPLSLDIGIDLAALHAPTGPPWNSEVLSWFVPPQSCKVPFSGTLGASGFKKNESWMMVYYHGEIWGYLGTPPIAPPRPSKLFITHGSSGLIIPKASRMSCGGGYGWARRPGWGPYFLGWFSWYPKNYPRCRLKILENHGMKQKHQSSQGMTGKLGLRSHNMLISIATLGPKHHKNEGFHL